MNPEIVLNRLCDMYYISLPPVFVCAILFLSNSHASAESGMDRQQQLINNDSFSYDNVFLDNQWRNRGPDTESLNIQKWASQQLGRSKRSDSSDRKAGKVAETTNTLLARKLDHGQRFLGFLAVGEWINLHWMVPMSEEHMCLSVDWILSP